MADCVFPSQQRALFKSRRRFCETRSGACPTGATLGSCFTDTCTDPELRVEARVFQLTDRDPDPSFGTFADYSSGNVKLPPAIAPVQYLGSTTAVISMPWMSKQSDGCV